MDASATDKNLPTREGSKKIKVLLVAAPKKDIEHYDRLVSGTKLEVSAIELETFSITRALVGEDTGTFLIIDIGSRATNMILVEKGVVRVNRNIDAGGNEITIAISDSMSISRQRAEIFKRGEKDFLNTTESSFIVPVLELIIGESRRILSAYLEKNKDLRIDNIFLSGGSANMKGMEQHFSNALAQPVTIGNPWRRISVKPEATELVKSLGTSFSVALGLALRGMDEYKRK
jgi:type IV pilus assembly protein PilM